MKLPPHKTAKLHRLFAPFLLLVVLLLSFRAVSPLMHAGFYAMHDNTQITRVYEMHKSLHDGMFPVRWVPDLGYGFGYAIFNFYAPLAYYAGSFFMSLGFGALSATKIMIGLGVLLAGVFMYLLARDFWGEIGGSVSALLYVYAPYHAVNLYVRGAIAELWAYAFVPLLFYGFYKLYKTLDENNDRTEKSKVKSQKSKMQFKIQNFSWIHITVCAVAYAGIILSHNLTALMVSPFLLAALVIFGSQFYKEKRLYALSPLLFALFLGLGLSAFYWLPAFAELKFTNVGEVLGGGSDYHLHYVCLKQLWESQWGYGGSVPGCLDGMSFRIGKLNILSIVISLISLFFLYKSQKQKAHAVVLASAGFLLSVFLMLPQSQFIWDSLSVMQYFQFPWRFLLLASFFSSFAAGSIFIIPQNIKQLKTRVLPAQLVLALLFLAGIWVLYAKLFTPVYVSAAEVNRQTDDSYLHYTVSKISDEYLPRDFLKPISETSLPTEKFSFLHGVGQIQLTENRTNQLTARITTPVAGGVLINTSYFPAWQVFVDGQQISISDDRGRIAASVPAGTHTMSVRFIQTTVEKLGNMLSLGSLALIVIGIMSMRKRHAH